MFIVLQSNKNLRLFVGLFHPHKVVDVHPVLLTIFKRLGLGLLTLLLVSIIIFSAINMLPGDFGQAVLGQSATEDTVAAFRRELGLDQPAVLRYFDWIGAVATGDLGTSFSGRASSGVDRSRPVLELIAPRLQNTLFLAAMTATIAVPIALFLGVTAALWRNSWYDKSASVATLTTISFPEFFVAYILILFFATMWPIFPSLADIRSNMSFWDRVYASMLPAMTLTLVIVAHMMRMTRAAIINLLASPYIEMARLKGESPRRIILKHALPNAWAPIATVIAFNLAYLVVGVVVVEVVFVYPGVGQLMVDAVSSRDIPVVQACALIFAATYILLNLTADVIGIVTNPRLLHPK
jgi:peptide/nickel transport system permease protein